MLYITWKDRLSHQEFKHYIRITSLQVLKNIWIKRKGSCFRSDHDKCKYTLSIIEIDMSQLKKHDSIGLTEDNQDNYLDPRHAIDKIKLIRY